MAMSLVNPCHRQPCLPNGMAVLALRVSAIGNSSAVEEPEPVHCQLYPPFISSFISKHYGEAAVSQALS